MTRASVVALLCTALAGCNRPEAADRSNADGVDARRAAITGGAPDSADPAVVALVARPLGCGAPPTLFCTGTLIAPRVVVTAAHCLDFAPPGGMEVVLGGDALAAGAERIAVDGAWPHPAWVHPVNDIAVLALRRAASAAPASLARSPLDATLVGSLVRVAGFGADDAMQTGEKRAGTAQVSELTDGTFTVVAAPAVSCDGDSGGPVFATQAGGEVLAGVTSFGDPRCQVSATNTRVDVHVAGFLDPMIAMIDGSAPVARGAIDPAADYCTLGCARDDQCPADMTCVRGHCGLFGMEPGRFGAACVASAAAATCSDGTCVNAGADCRCYRPCATSSGCSVVSGAGRAGVSGRGAEPARGALIVLAAMATLAALGMSLARSLARRQAARRTRTRAAAVVRSDA